MRSADWGMVPFLLSPGRAIRRRRAELGLQTDAGVGLRGAGPNRCPLGRLKLFGGDSQGLRLQPRGVEHVPDGIVDREVHVAGENREAVVAVIRPRIVPRMHLAEGNAHLLHRVLLLDAGADQVGPDFLDELLEFVAGHVVVDQRALLHVVAGALVIVVVAEFVAGADDLHAEVFIGVDDMARAAGRRRRASPSCRRGAA